jgi:hypothetical protein
VDPNQTLRAFWNAVAASDWNEAREHGDNLSDWMNRGGFPPDNLTCAFNMFYRIALYTREG